MLYPVLFDILVYKCIEAYHNTKNIYKYITEHKAKMPFDFHQFVP